MNALMSDSRTQWMRILWIVPLAAAAHLFGQPLSAMALQSVNLAPPQIPLAGTSGQQAAWGLLSALILAAGMTPLARQLRGRLVTRWLVLAAFLYLLNTANTTIELAIFSKFGGEGHIAALGVLPALLCAGVLTAIRPVSGNSLGLVDAQSGAGWAGRLALGWLAFPAVYFFFGILIAPFVIEAYSAENSMIVLPPMRAIIAVQAIRSMLFLLPSLAVIERWTGTRLGLWLALGWAHWALVGLSGLVMPLEFMSPQVRLIHALEIGADSFVYAGILVALFAGRNREDESLRRLPPLVETTTSKSISPK